MGDHLLVGELVTLGALDDIVQHEDSAIIGGFEDEDVLVLAFLVVEDVLDLESHSLAGPHVGDLAEPAICHKKLVGFRFQGGMKKASRKHQESIFAVRLGSWKLCRGAMAYLEGEREGGEDQSEGQTAALPPVQEFEGWRRLKVGEAKTKKGRL
jgi:hypothetical protein